MDPHLADFNAVLYPNRALNQRGLIILVTVLVFSMLYVGLLFYHMGAWPVLGFCVAELAIILLILYIHHKASRHREHVRLENTHLVIEDRPYKSPPRVWRLPRGRIRVYEDEYKKCIVVCAHNTFVQLGGFLSAEERGEFIQSLKKALHSY